MGIKVLLISNEVLTRAGVRSILSELEGINVIGEAADAEEGLRQFERLRPDVTILSLRMPGFCAVDQIADYFRISLDAGIMILADHSGDVEIRRTLEKGALGYVCKDVTEADLADAVRRVAQGRRFVPTPVAEVLTAHIGNDELTKAEQRVLEMIVGGMTNKEIAFGLEISENTVKTHVSRILDKLRVSDRTSAATTAIRRGLVRIDI